MTSCPNCKATLPDGAGSCQFCGAMFGPAAGGPGRAPRPAYTGGTPTWVWPVYYFIAGYWVLDGAWEIVRSLVFAQHIGAAAVVGIIVGLINVVVGMGLILKIEIIRGIVNVFCFINILFGILGFLGSAVATGAVGELGVLGMISSAITVATSGLMVFLIGETAGAPRF